MSVCPTIYPSVPLFVIRRLSISLIIHISILLFLNSSFHVSVYLSDCRSFSLLIILTVCLSVALSLCSSFRLSVCLSVSLSVYLSDVTVWLQHEAVVWLSVFSHPETEREERKRHSSETFIKPDPEDLKRTHITLQLSFFSWTVERQSLL